MTSPLTSWSLGLDLAQCVDRSVLATLSLHWTYSVHRPRNPRLVLRDIERFPYGTSYLAYSNALARRQRHIAALAAKDTRPLIHLTVDAGGPGAPVVEELRRARLHMDLKALVITGGRAPGAASSGAITVPRRLLLANLLLLIDHGKLHVPAGLPGWRPLYQELLALDAATWHPAKSTAHDDMVIALALAAWRISRLHRELMPAPQRLSLLMHSR